jgi:plastocyanin
MHPKHMRPTTIRMTTAKILIPAVFFMGGVAACGGDDTAPGAAPSVTEMPFDVATAGNVRGMIMFEGTPPTPEPIDMASEPDCLERWDEAPVRELVRVRGGHLADVFVYVKEGLEDMEFPVTAEATVVDQYGCKYVPHVSGVMANQTVTFRNSDGLLHNVNATPQINRPFNFSQPVNMDTNRTFAQSEVMIPVRCDVHGWMLAYVGVVGHPYHSVSGDGGGFDLSDLPPGDYVIEAWHSRLGTQEQQVTVTTGETVEVNFTFNEGMLATAQVPMADPIDPHYHNPLLVHLGRHDHGGNDDHGGHTHTASMDRR